VGARTDAARAEVVARRAELLGEVERLEASARAAVDIPAKVRRHPLRTVGAAGGAAFLALGGPKRLYRRAKVALFGPDADLPRTMLPNEIERTLRRLGSDGDRVRGSIEREFAKFLESRTKVRREGDVRELAVSVAGNLFKPLSSRLGKRLAAQLLESDAQAFDDALGRIRRRRETAPTSTAGREPAQGSGE
jgi:hypothetical protein